MDMKSSKLVQTGVVLIVLGLASYCIELIFYNSVVENGFMIDRMFLPLAFILGFLGSLLIVLAQLMGWFASQRSK